MGGQSDLQKKDELRRELRVLEIVEKSFKEISDPSNLQDFAKMLVCDRIDDIRKALED